MKRILLLIFTIVSVSTLHTVSMATTTVVTNCENIPVQDNYNSTKVIKKINNNTSLTKLDAVGEFYKIKTDEIEGYINRAYTVEGAKEKEAERKAQEEKEKAAAAAAANSSSDSNLSANSTFAEVAAERKKYVRDHDYYYSQGGPIVPANYTKTRKTDCSAYVSDVIYHYGKLKNSSGLMSIGRKSSHYFNGIGKNLKSGKSNSYFGLITSTSNMKPGDILCYNGHVEIYAGGFSGGRPYVYNCGSNSSIKSSNIITKSAKSTSKLTYILRVK